MMRSQRVMA